MKKYIGKNVVQTEPMTGTKAYKIGLIDYEPSEDEMGYYVLYCNGITSWHSKEEFEDTYKVAETPLDRAHLEFDELLDRYNKLKDFIVSGKSLQVIKNKYDRDLLAMQYFTMLNYLNILGLRADRMQGSSNTEINKMDFGMAIKALRLHYFIRRKEWDKDLCIVLVNKTVVEEDSDCILIYNRNTEQTDHYNPTVADILAKDWEIIV